MAGWLDSLIDFGIKAAPTVAKAGLSYLGQQETAQSQQQTAQAQIDQLNQNAAAAQAAATPWNVGSLGGTAGFNPDTQTSSLLLSPELSNVYSGLLSRSGMFGGQAGQYANLDPFMAGEQFYQQQQQYYEPDEQRLRTELETRLLNQGRLGARCMEIIYLKVKINNKCWKRLSVEISNKDEQQGLVRHKV